MIVNLDSSEVKDKIEEETGGNEAIARIVRIIGEAGGSYSIDPFGKGLEFLAEAPVKGKPRTCRLKIWQPEEGKILAWFYRRSSVPHSRDRFSYGGVELELDKVGEEEIREKVGEWLRWLDNGFAPEMRPEGWVSAFNFDIPD